MEPQTLPLETLTINNANYREVVAYNDTFELTLMSLQPYQDIGMEVHDDITQFLRIESGSGHAVLNDEKMILSPGDAVIVPPGTSHNIIAGADGLKLYTIYAPRDHTFADSTAVKENIGMDVSELNKLNTGNYGGPLNLVGQYIQTRTWEDVFNNEESGVDRIDLEINQPYVLIQPSIHNNQLYFAYYQDKLIRLDLETYQVKGIPITIPINHTIVDVITFNQKIYIVMEDTIRRVLQRTVRFVPLSHGPTITVELPSIIDNVTVEDYIVYGGDRYIIMVLYLSNPDETVIWRINADTTIDEIGFTPIPFEGGINSVYSEDGVNNIIMLNYDNPAQIYWYQNDNLVVEYSTGLPVSIADVLYKNIRLAIDENTLYLTQLMTDSTNTLTYDINNIDANRLAVTDNMVVNIIMLDDHIAINILKLV